MGPLATAVMSASLAALRWLFLVTALLAVVALAVQAVRGENIAPLGLALVAGACFVCGLFCGWASKKIRLYS